MLHLLWPGGETPPYVQLGTPKGKVTIILGYISTTDKLEQLILGVYSDLITFELAFSTVLFIEMLPGNKAVVVPCCQHGPQSRT